MKISTWAEVIGIVALILSLVFVGVELRHSTATASAQAMLDLNESVNDIMMAQAEDSELAAIALKGMTSVENLNDIERHRFENLLASVFNFHENAFIFYQNGVISADDYEAYVDSVCSELSHPGHLAFWRNSGYSFQDEFESFILERCDLAK